MDHPSLKALVEEGVSNAPKMLWPTYDGKQLDRDAFVTASEVGNCLRSTWFSKNANPPQGDTEVWGYFARGHNVEAWVVEQLRRSNSLATFIMMGSDQRSMHWEGQAGTPDGIMLTTEGNYVFDIKSIDPRTNRKYLPKKTHLMQIHQNILLAENCLDGMEIAGGMILYVDASNYQTMNEYYVEYDHSAMEQVTDRANRIHAAEKPGDLPAEGMFNDGCKFCPFTANCSDAVRASNEKLAQAKTHRKVASNVFGKP